ncbi:MAG TPA: DnaB-like helicase N-terminal domain-containing protein, partial [Anaerolineae bacterium]|nr:DnaB-like helicase N-terminal domain-containing protein [Anaerolineae bacterium]
MTKNVLPPHNIEAEEATLGALLIDPKWAIPQVQPLLKGPAFYLQKHRWLYAVLLDLYARHEPVDFLTVTTEMEKRGQLEAVGGAVFITQLLDAVPSAASVVSYAREVQQTHVRRRILEACSAAARLAYDAQRPIEQVVTESVLLATLAVHALRMGVPTALFSIEMRGLEVAGRILQKEL